MEWDRDDPLKICEAYRAAVLARDESEFLSLYDPDVCVYDIWNQWSYQGLDEWRKMVAGWFASLGEESVAVEIGDVRMHREADLAVIHASVLYKGISAEGSELHAVPNRLTWVLRRRDSIWKIIHEHTSVPVESGSGEAIFQRE